MRELHEEVDLRLDASCILGRLDDFVTRSGFVITPVVVWAGAARDMQPNPAEVQSIHRIPVEEFMRADAPWLDVVDSSEHPVLRMPVGDTWIAAPTAAVLYQFRELCIHGRPPASRISSSPASPGNEARAGSAHSATSIDRRESPRGASRAALTRPISTASPRPGPVALEGIAVAQPTPRSTIALTVSLSSIAVPASALRWPGKNFMTWIGMLIWICCSIISTSCTGPSP